MKTPTNRKDWQIYDGRNSSNAARALTAALKRTFETIDANISGGETIKKATMMAAKEHMAPVHLKFAKEGAQDTEPRYVATMAILDFLEERYGIERPDYDLGDAIEGCL